jgi:hypothetical protein
VIVLLTSLLRKEGEEGLPHRYLYVVLLFFFDRNIAREAPAVQKKNCQKINLTKLYKRATAQKTVKEIYLSIQSQMTKKKNI